MLLQKYLFNAMKLSFYYCCMTMEILNSYSLLMLLVPTIYRPNKNFEELISSSVYPNSLITKSSNI